MTSARFVEPIVSTHEAQDLVAFMLRELIGPNEIADTVYASIIEPCHKALYTLWAMATGREPDKEKVKLAVVAFDDQGSDFRISPDFFERRMSRDKVCHSETRMIISVVIANLRDAIERQRI